MIKALEIRELREDSSESFLLDQIDLTSAILVNRRDRVLQVHFDLEYAIKNRLEEFCEVNGIICNRFPLFDGKDYSDASFFRLLGLPSSGYPYPQEEFLQFKTNNYEFKCLSNGCRSGKLQLTPFIITEINNIDKLKIFMSNWIFDDLFMKIEIYQEYFEPLGIKHLPVFRINGKSPNPKIVQIDIPILDHGIENNNMTYVTCEFCGNRIYDDIQLDFIPMPEVIPKYPIWKTRETLLGGDRLIIFNRTILEIFQSLKIKMSYHPCAHVNI